MAQARTTVVLGLLGPTLDAGRLGTRWDRWRPTVSVCQHPDLLVSRYELIHQPAHAALAATVLDDIRRVSPETTARAMPVRIADPWDLEEVYGTLHDLARGYPFRPDDEDYLVHITTGTHVEQICLFLLAESRHIPGRILQTSPPRRDPDVPATVERKRTGPAGRYTVIDLDLSRYDKLASRFQAEQREGVASLKGGIETRNPRFNALIDRMERVAMASRAPILLTGPTGAGKTALARRIYGLKRARRQVTGAFVEVNCATLRGDGAMSALFGHVKGAFTGALSDRAGLLRKADSGVAFLDEIGELGMDEQAMLLRALEERVFLPMGSDREVSSDFQLLAGTNRDLAARVAEGRFREDLLARINLWSFSLPALRDRLEDLAPNLDWELDAFTQRTGTRVTFNREARTAFLAFAMAPEARWTGNFRDLSAAVTRMATLAPGGRIDSPTVTEEISRLRAAWHPGPDGTPGREPSTPDVTLVGLLGPDAVSALDRFDRVQLSDVVRACQSAASLSAAGRVLFAASRARRSTVNDTDRLRKYLARFGLTWQQIRGD